MLGYLDVGWMKGGREGEKVILGDRCGGGGAIPAAFLV